jgi:uncharacterized protein YfaT (DUF1175 family)
MLVSVAVCSLARAAIVATPDAITVLGDGREHQVVVLRCKAGWLGLSADSIQVRGGIAGVHLQQDGRSVRVWLRSPVQPGRHRLVLESRGFVVSLPVDVRKDEIGDAAQDGLPDWMPLHSEDDRHAFRSWFTQLAERQAAPGAVLPSEISDCASLLRYAYREALVQHDDKWYAQFSAEQMPPLTSVGQWSYPNTALGLGLFRSSTGPYSSEQATDGTFSQFADARALMLANTYLVSRRLKDARPGDLIFYRQLEQNSSYHSMILTGERGEWVVYHTGPIGKSKGEMRRVLVEDLLHHPDARWRPLPENSNFLGIFRWKILRDEP